MISLPHLPKTATVEAPGLSSSCNPPLRTPRGATPADLSELLRLEALSFTGDRVSKRSFQRWLKTTTNWIVVHDNPDEPQKLLGYGLVLFHYRGRIARIYSLAIDPEWRGRGLGRTLLESCIEQARQRGCSEIRLEVSTGNLPALRLYAQTGFEIFGHRPAYYQDGSDAVRLRASVRRRTSAPL